MFPCGIDVFGLNAALRAGWSDFIENSAGATAFHDLNWMQAVQEVYGHRPCYLAAVSESDQRIVGILPLFEVNGPFTGRALISVPYAVYGGVVSDSSDARSALAGSAKTLSERVGAKYLEIRQETCIQDFHNQCHYFAFRRELPSSPDELLVSFPRKSRASIRQARDQFKLTVRTGHDLLGVFHRLYCVSLRRLASPPHSKRFFQRLLELYGDRCWIHVVFHEARPVAGVLSFCFKNEVLPYFAGIDRDYSHMQTSNFMYFQLMDQAIRAGLNVFDFGRTRQNNQGGCQFKRNQGFEARPLSYSFYSSVDKRPPDLRPTNSKFAFAQAIWRKLPLRVVAAAGGAATRWLP
jgi:FemAB-related protein (PEP-CTERM system-associated)